MTYDEAQSQATAFLGALAEGLPEEERMIVCGFPGDPNGVGPAAWRPRAWRPGRDLPIDPRHHNAYVTVASFGRAEDGSFRRRTETFRAGRALMVDDVGTKVPPEIVAHAPPSAIVETSPGNFQWWYILAEPERDAGRFDGVIRAFISGKLLGADPGMSGIARVGRIPGFLNAKKAYVTPARPGGFRVNLVELSPRRFTVRGLLDAFQLKILGRRDLQHKNPRRGVPADARERITAFYVAYGWMFDRGMLKKDAPDLSGWTEATCPWVDGHTLQADTGAAVREPDDANGYYGGFKCHHGGCADRGWRDLTEWINDASVEELDRANALPQFPPQPQQPQQQQQQQDPR